MQGGMKAPQGSEWIRTLPAKDLCWISAGKGAQNVGSDSFEPKGTSSTSKPWGHKKYGIYPFSNFDLFSALPTTSWENSSSQQNFFNLSVLQAFPQFPWKLSCEFWSIIWEIFVRLLRATASPGTAELGAAQIEKMRCRIYQRDFTVNCASPFPPLDMISM